MNRDPLLAELYDLMRKVDPLPKAVRAAAEAVFALAFPPPGWTFLEPVRVPVLTRAGARSLRFADNEVSVRVELRADALRGLVTPVLPVSLCWPSGKVAVRPDASGFFVVDQLPSGPLRLLVGETRVTRWFHR